MTDEEKAKDKYCNHCGRKDTCYHAGKVLGLCDEVRGYIAGLTEGREETKKQWRDCFLSCSSPYCAGHFRDVKFEGTLGNMTKGE